MQLVPTSNTYFEFKKSAKVVVTFTQIFEEHTLYLVFIVDDETSLVVLAENDFNALGFQVYYELEPALLAPENGVELSVAGIYEPFMGLGVGKSL